MLLMNSASANISILGMMVPGGSELLEEMGREIKETHHVYSDGIVAEYELIGTQIIYNKEWLDTKKIYGSDNDVIRKECNFIIDGKPNDRMDNKLNNMYQVWSSDGRTLEVWDTEKGNKLVIQIVFGLGDIPVKQQKYLFYLATKLTSFPEEATVNDVDQLLILYKRFKQQYLAA